MGSNPRIRTRAVAQNRLIPLRGQVIKFTVVIIGGILTAAVNPIFAQTAATGSPVQSGADSILASLPGVLIGGIALIFAVRASNRAKRLQLEVDDAHHRCAADQHSPSEHCQVALWQTDSNGNTTYANASMCRLLGVDDVQELEDIVDSKLLHRIENGQGSSQEQPYRAVLNGLTGTDRCTVLILEKTLAEQGRTQTTLRTVIDTALLPDRLLNQHDSEVTVTA